MDTVRDARRALIGAPSVAEGLCSRLILPGRDREGQGSDRTGAFVVNEAT